MGYLITALIKNSSFDDDIWALVVCILNCPLALVLYLLLFSKSSLEVVTCYILSVRLDPLNLRLRFTSYVFVPFFFFFFHAFWSNAVTVHVLFIEQ